MAEAKRHHPLWLLFDRVRRKMRARSARKRREKERQQLLPRKDEIISSAYVIFDGQLRSASVAAIGGFRPPEEPTASWFGNVLIGQEGEAWPSWSPPDSTEVVFLTPLGQFNLTEALFVPERLRRFKMITIFIDAEELPCERPCGEGWVVRAYESLEDLVPLKRPDAAFEIKAFPMKWELVEDEGPSWEDACDMADLREFHLVADSEYEDRYRNSERTKLGGYPALIQGSLSFGLEHFVFQIGSEDKAGWMWGDCGIGYFGLNEKGEWILEWNCY